MNSRRDTQEASVAVLEILSNIFHARQLLKPNCFHSVGKRTLKKRQRQWSDLIANHRSGGKKLSQCDGVKWKPQSTIFLHEGSSDPGVMRIVAHMKDILRMIEDGDLVKVYVCLFDKKTKTPDPVNLVELFTLQVRHEPDMSTAVNLSWMGLSKLAPPPSVKTKRKCELTVEKFLQHLEPIKKKVYTLLKHQIKESKRAKWASWSNKSNFDLLAAKQLLSERPECKTWPECVTLRIPARELPATDTRANQEDTSTLNPGRKRQRDLSSDQEDISRISPVNVHIDWSEGSEEGPRGNDGASDNSPVGKRTSDTSPTLQYDTEYLTGRHFLHDNADE